MFFDAWRRWRLGPWRFDAGRRGFRPWSFAWRLGGPGFSVLRYRRMVLHTRRGMFLGAALLGPRWRRFPGAGRLYARRTLSGGG